MRMYRLVDCWADRQADPQDSKPSPSRQSAVLHFPGLKSLLILGERSLKRGKEGGRASLGFVVSGAFAWPQEPRAQSIATGGEQENPRKKKDRANK